MAQNDLPEFLLFLIDSFHNALCREVQMNINGIVLNDKDVLAKKCYEMMKNMYRKEFSEILTYFYGIHVSNIISDKKKILSSNPDGIFLSNGQGDPAAVSYGIKTVKKLLGKKPIFGICLGHQILALALGATTFKMKFGHRGINQPVKNLITNNIEITSQNHGFAVDKDSLPSNVEVTHKHLNDNTVAGIRCNEISAYSVQYHPEASPGPHDSRYVFKEFFNMMEQNAKA